MTEAHKSTIFILGILLAALSLSGCGEMGKDLLYSQATTKGSFSNSSTSDDLTQGGDWTNSSDECSYEDFSYGDPKTIGFWKHQIKGILSDRHNLQVEPEDVEVCLPLALFGMLFEDLDELNDVLWLKKATMEERAIQQCVASKLNLCYGELCKGSLVYSVGNDGVLDSFADAMEFAATAFAAGDYEMAKDVCDTINNL